ncbi:MAG: peptidylprolyl isomerase [Desulfobaccales bacterium]
MGPVSEAWLMKGVLLALLASAVILPSGSGAQAQQKPVQVKLVTGMGDIVLELYPDKAPATVENFLQYIREGHYNNTVFHRVIKGFMIQGGGLDADLREKPTRAPIPNEADNGLKNEPYTIAMARTPEPHSASSQFFINLADNKFLNHRDKTPDGWGYAVFGRVVAGKEVVDKIEAVPTADQGMHQNVPQPPVPILSTLIIGQ